MIKMDNNKNQRTNILRIFLALITLLSLNALPAFSSEFACDEKSVLTTFDNNKFVIENDKARNIAALELAPCIASKSSKIRDEITFTTISSWHRENKLTQATTTKLFTYFIQQLKIPKNDKDNFKQPFAALLLSEVVRVDRVSPYLTDKQRQQAIKTTITYMKSITDYRGFSEPDGWRHAVAHTADVFLQLALNKNITPKSGNNIAKAIFSQVSPIEHFYIYGEPRRLVLPLAYLMINEKLSIDNFDAMLKQLTNPLPFENWQAVYSSQQGLAKRHNTRLFLMNFYTLIADSENAKLKAVKPLIKQALKSIGG